MKHFIRSKIYGYFDSLKPTAQILVHCEFAQLKVVPIKRIMRYAQIAYRKINRFDIDFPLAVIILNSTMQCKPQKIMVLFVFHFQFVLRF